MSDFRTMAEQSLVDQREVSANIDEVKLAIIDSCVHHQKHRFWFSELDFTLTTRTDIDTYGLAEGVPDRIMYLDDDLWLDVDGDPNNRHRVTRQSVDYLETLRSHQQYSNWPEHCAVKGAKLLLWPLPDGAHTLRFRGTQKIAAPRKHYDTAAAAWVFPDGDNFTNEWFVEGERSVREYANYLRLHGPIGDQVRATMALQRHLEALQDLIEETGTRLMPPRLEPWPRFMG